MNVGNNAGSGETNFEEIRNPSTGSLNSSVRSVLSKYYECDSPPNMNTRQSYKTTQNGMPSSPENGMPSSPEEVKIEVTEELTDMEII